MNPLYDWDKRLEGSIQLIKEDSQLAKPNKTRLLEFKRFLLVEKGLKPVRVVKYLYTLRIVLGWLGNRSCTMADKEDLLCIVERIDSNGFKDWTKHDYKLVVRVFWQWLGKDDLVSWIKVNKANTSKLPEELLTPYEIQDMVNAANNARDRAIIAVLYESNTRIGEFASLRIKHIVFEIIQDTLTAVLIVDGKTGMRRLRIVQSVPYLQEWIRQHPRGGDPEAWVWVNHNLPKSSKSITYAAFRQVLKTCAKKAGIKKNVHPHLLRHSRSTYLANHLTESQLCCYSGWVMGSNMAATYVHLSGKDIDNSILEMNRLGSVKETLEGVKESPIDGVNETFVNVKETSIESVKETLEGVKESPIDSVNETFVNVKETLEGVKETPTDSVNEIETVGGRPKKVISGFTVDLLEFIKHNEGLTAVEISKIFDRKNDNIRRYLHNLKNYGYLTNHAGKWYLAPADKPTRVIEPIAEAPFNFNINQRRLAEAVLMEV